ncbi:MAG: HAD-IIIC family phosphatase [Pseudonocardiaceae bacterium]
MSPANDIDQPAAPNRPGRGRIKCVVWDLDDTLWDGVLLEDSHVRIRPEVVETITHLDRLGVLHSVASRNDRDAALTRLRTAGLDDYFLYPQISWNPKSQLVARIADELNIGLGTVAFVDDQPFERAEVANAHPEVLCVDAADAWSLRHRPEFQPRFVTDESRLRRTMYRSDAHRRRAEQQFTGTSEEFLATLNMELTITPAQPGDLQRAEELTVRTNQLNATGRPYTYQELNDARRRDNALLLVMSLRDRFGDYGTIGLALADLTDHVWRLRLLLVSCRVMSRGVGTVLLGHVAALANNHGAQLLADFVDTGRNRMMYLTYVFSGFHEVNHDGDVVIFSADPDRLPAPPDYLTITTRA